MFRFQLPILFGLFLVSNVPAQSLPPASPNRPPAPAKESPAIQGSPSGTPTERELIDTLGPNDLQAIITLLKSNFTNQQALGDLELNRATIEGLLHRLSPG